MLRREFIKKSTMAGSISLLPLEILANSLKTSKNNIFLDQIGLQLFSIPFLLENDFEKTLAMLSEMGYSKLELYGPYTFSAASAKENWKNLAPRLGFSGSGFFGREAAELARLLHSNNLSVPAIHTDLDTLENEMGGLASAAETLGFEYVVLPALPEEKRSSMEDYKATADLFNRIGKSAVDHGIKFAYHNHGYGLVEMEGQIPLQYLIENTDPEWLFLEMDIFWTTAGRADPLEYLKKYPGRYRLMHVKDMKEKKHFSGDGGNPSQWMELFPLMCPAGDGIIELEKIIPVAIESGVEHFIVEQDLVKEPQQALSQSIGYLKSI